MSLFSGNPTSAQSRGRVKDFINWNMPLLTGREADYGGSPDGTAGQGGSNYWLNALTGNTAANQADQASAAAHSGGWQGWLADSFTNANAAERAAGTSTWNPTGWMNTETGTRTNFDTSTPFLRLSDLRATTGYTDPSGSNYTVPGDFQSRSYDPTAAEAASAAANFMPAGSANWNNYANEGSEAATAAAASAANSGAVTTNADGSIQTNDTTGGNNNTATGAPSVDDIKNYLGSAYQLYLDRDPVYNDDFSNTADYWIQQVQDRFNNNDFGGNTWQDWLSRSIRGGEEYSGLTGGDNTGGDNTGGDNTGGDGWWNQFADADAFKTFLQGDDTGGTDQTDQTNMQDFMQFMMMMNMMGGGQGGGSQYGYGGLNPGGVAQAFDYRDMASWMQDTFGSGSGSGTTASLNVGG